MWLYYRDKGSWMELECKLFIARNILTKVRKRMIKENRGEERCLLILDNNTSHKDPKVSDLCS